MWERQQLAELQQEQLSQAQYYLQQAISAHTSEQKGNDPSDGNQRRHDRLEVSSDPWGSLEEAKLSANLLVPRKPV